jgi:hypothetical protein
MERSDRRYYPTHGAPIDQPQAYVAALLEHRLQREAAILACLRAGQARITDIVEALYRDVPRHLHPAAAQSVAAHLIHLVEEGVIDPALIDGVLAAKR